jgi:hypothetical protein
VTAVQSLHRPPDSPQDRRRLPRLPDDRLTRAVWLIVGALTLLYAVLVLVRLDRIITDLLWNSDYASGLTLAQTVAHAGSAGNTTISTTGAWMDLWFGLVTTHLPLHRQLWEISPTILFILSALVIGRAVWRLSGPVTGIASALAILLASPWALAIFLAPVAHNTVYPTTAILGGGLPWILRHRDRGRVAWALVLAVSAVLLGTSLASDKLVLVTGIVPLALTALIALWQRSGEVRRAAVGVLAVIVLAIPVELATNAIMTAEGYAITSPKLVLASLRSWPFHLRLLLDGIRQFSGSYLMSRGEGTWRFALGLLCTLVLVLVVAVFVVGAVRMLRALVLQRSMEHPELGRALHVSYWFASALVTCAAFVCSTADGGNTSSHDSYFLTVVFSAGATVPLLVGGAYRLRLPRRAGAIALAVFALGSSVGVTQGGILGVPKPLAAYAGSIVSIARADHVRYGYAGYWDASSLTWESDEAVLVRPLLQCSNPDPRGAGVCPFLLMRTASWYRPVHRRSFLLVDPDNVFVTSLPANLGRPLAVHPIGPLTMYVYPYDIASKLGPYPVWTP